MDEEVTLDAALENAAELDDLLEDDAELEVVPPKALTTAGYQESAIFLWPASVG